jgi:hypothetical protein
MAGSPIVFRTDQGASGASNTAKTAVDIVALLAHGAVDRDIWVGHTLHLICTGPHFADRVVRWCYVSRAMTRATCVGVHKRSPRIVLLPCDLQSWGRGFESLHAHIKPPLYKGFFESLSPRHPQNPSMGRVWGELAESVQPALPRNHRARSPLPLIGTPPHDLCNSSERWRH